MLTIMLRTVIMYAFLIFSIRLLGKRQLGELEVSELVTTLMVSELAVTPITNAEMSIWNGLVPVAVLVSVEVAVSLTMVHFPKTKRLFSGTPSVLIQNGRLSHKAIKEARIGVDELLSALRQSGYASIEDIGYAILEANGKLSVIPAAEKAPSTPEDHGIKKAERGIAHGIIIDGFVNERSLEQSGKDHTWLGQILKKEGIDAKDVLLLTVDDNDRIWYQLREE